MPDYMAYRSGKPRGCQLDCSKSSGPGVEVGLCQGTSMCHACLHQTLESETITYVSCSENTLKMTSSKNQWGQIIYTQYVGSLIEISRM